MGNLLGALGDVLTRDAGHALNATTNVFTGQGLHGTGNALGTGLVNYAHSDPNNPGVIFNTANLGVQSNQPAAPRNIDTGSTQAPNNSAADITGGTAFDGSGGSGGTGLTAQQILANNQAIALGNDSLNRLPAQLQAALGQIQNTYNQNNNQLQSGYDAANQQYGQSTQQNGQQFVANKNQINNQASQGIRSLLSILGQHGAGGSSAAMFAAPDAVSLQAAQQRAGAGQTFGQNQQSLDTNFNTYQTGFDNSKKQLADWLTQQQQAAQTNSENNRQSILSQLAGLQTNAGAAQPYIDQIMASRNAVDQLASFNPTYTGTTPTYTAPDVASYTVAQNGAPQLGNPGNSTGASSPLAFLLGLNKDKNTPQLSF